MQFHCFIHVSSQVCATMSTHKPNMQQKISLEARVYESLNRCFPEFKCSITDIKFPKSEFVINFYTFLLGELRFDVSKLMMVSSLSLSVLLCNVFAFC